MSEKEQTSLEIAGGCAVGFTGSISCYNADAEARFSKALLDVGKWVVAESGTWTADLGAGRVTDAEGRVLFESRQADGDDYWEQMKYFLSLLREEAPAPFNDVFEAYQILKLCLE